MKKSGASQGQSASELISKRIAELGDWRGETLSRMRTLIKDADPDVVEEWKWMGTPIWSHDGIICTGESYKNVVKLTFSKGASLKDPARLFNSSLDGNVRRAIDIREGDEVDQSAFKALVRQAVALNSSGKSKPSKKAKSSQDREGDRVAISPCEAGASAPAAIAPDTETASTASRQAPSWRRLRATVDSASRPDHSLRGEPAEAGDAPIRRPPLPPSTVDSACRCCHSDRHRRAGIRAPRCVHPSSSTLDGER